MKVGISINLDVTKIDKARIVEGKNGKYIDLQTFVDLDSEDKYGNNGFVSHKPTKAEREAKERTPIVGNVKVFWRDEETAPARQVNQDVRREDFSDDIPF